MKVIYVGTAANRKGWVLFNPKRGSVPPPTAVRSTSPLRIGAAHYANSISDLLKPLPGIT